MFARHRMLIAAATVAVALAGGCSSSRRAATPAPSTTTATTTTGVPGATSTGPATTAAPTTTLPATGAPVNRHLTDADKAQLAAAFASGRHIDPGYVGEVVAGARDAYDPAARREWALVDFSASAAAQRAHQRYAGTAQDPLIQFQDGPMVFSRPVGARWAFVGDTGGLVCPPRPPATVLALWSIRTVDCPS